jgi:hypothetical protein
MAGRPRPAADRLTGGKPDGQRRRPGQGKIIRGRVDYRPAVPRSGGVHSRQGAKSPMYSNLSDILLTDGAHQQIAADCRTLVEQ